MPNLTLAALAGGLALTGYSYRLESRAHRILSFTPADHHKHPRYPVSVIIPAYNETKYIANLMTSINIQCEPVAEVIVVDSSQDYGQTQDIAERLGAQVYGFPKGNVGAARNYGAHLASGEVLVFCDADTILDTCFVHHALDSLSQGYVATHPKDVHYDSTFWNVLVGCGQIFRPVTHTSRCVAVWRDVFDGVGGYDVTCNPLNGCREDLSLGARLVEHYGRGSLSQLSFLAATSARRWKKQGFRGLSDWGNSVRAYQISPDQWGPAT